MICPSTLQDLSILSLRPEATEVVIRLILWPVAIKSRSDSVYGDQVVSRLSLWPSSHEQTHSAAINSSRHQTQSTACGNQVVIRLNLCPNCGFFPINVSKGKQL